MPQQISRAANYSFPGAPSLASALENKENVLSIDMIQPTDDIHTRVPLAVKGEPLEVDEMGLFKIRPRATSDLSDLKPKFSSNSLSNSTQPTAFNEPISREQKKVSMPDHKNWGVPPGAAELTNTPISISERRYLKLVSKEESMRAKLAQPSPSKLQLPIKDTSERDPSVLSEARPLSEGEIQDLEQTELQ